MNPLLLELLRQSPALSFLSKQGKIPDSFKEKLATLSPEQEKALINLFAEEQIYECQRKQKALQSLESEIKFELIEEDDQCAENTLVKLNSL